MRKRLLVLLVTGMSLGAYAGPAAADEPVNSQVADQVAGNQQHADSSATSTQVGPSNQNISVRVLSPGDDGAVTQRNSSLAESYAGNHNSTDQSVEQSQSGSGSVGSQEAVQQAGSGQHASSEAESTQIKPKNQNISVRVLSPGDNGTVDQSNSSEAKSGAKNSNELSQDVDQSQGGAQCGCQGNSSHGDDRHGDHGHGAGDSTGIQAAGQEAWNEQKAESSATSTQIKPSNQAISVRVLSPGDDGAVTQSNASTAMSKALNHNSTSQAIDQSQGGSRCGCGSGTAIQAAGQAAYNRQKAESAAESKQIHPENSALSLRLKSHGGGGELTQANASNAASFASNWNALEQELSQSQGHHEA
jgi:hypothetical protein